MTTPSQSSVRIPERLTFPPGAIPDPIQPTSDPAWFDRQPYCSAIDPGSRDGDMCCRMLGHTGRHLVSDGRWIRTVWSES